MKHVLVLLAALPLFAAQPAPKSSLAERIGADGFIQVKAESFHALNARQKELVWWLTRASIAIDPVIYDQLGRNGLREKYILELIVSHPQAVDPAVRKKILDYTKVFWANHGNHNDITAQKFVPEF